MRLLWRSYGKSECKGQNINNEVKLGKVQGKSRCWGNMTEQPENMKRYMSV